ncbi:hypothetical protein PspMM1_19280 [Pseudoalteromonas sp. MM1]|uniref:hypothetical protein n=2 Tax=unclassified Pseudoalteromonas TaxID=194690 RepID=UPI00257443CE|nr:hypothetical protein [Pseudoalteromonas sp. MM1]BED89460.1 hypothetical protein PspMM1_19280 [Pseudoalteromonas sp. MM1]
MNQYLSTLLSSIGIDFVHLKNKYLSPQELTYIDKLLASKKDFEGTFYTDEHGDKLEVLLMFLNAHKEGIINIMGGKGKTETLNELYTSSVTSGSYDCFCFDLSKFPQSYTPLNQTLTLYRIGRDGESKQDLGCSWAMEIEGLNAFYHSSGMSKSTLKAKPVFLMEIDDSQVLFEGNVREHELVLKPNFAPNILEKLDEERRNRISS